ncbi:MAG TPA: enoyl-CoA hydratase/isomerase family protein [Propionibacteriaceae bacterium]
MNCSTRSTSPPGRWCCPAKEKHSARVATSRTPSLPLKTLSQSWPTPSTLSSAGSDTSTCRRSPPYTTFAAVHGACLGVGLGIALACDVTIAADSARLGSPFARIGAVLDSGGHHHLVHRFGEHRALELIYTGRLLNGTEATEWDLVNRAVPEDESLAVARRIAAGPTQASGCRSGSRIASPTPP